MSRCADCANGQIPMCIEPVSGHTHIECDGMLCPGCGSRPVSIWGLVQNCKLGRYCAEYECGSRYAVLHKVNDNIYSRLAVSDVEITDMCRSLSIKDELI